MKRLASSRGKSKIAFFKAPAAEPDTERERYPIAKSERASRGFPAISPHTLRGTSAASQTELMALKYLKKEEERLS